MKSWDEVKPGDVLAGHTIQGQEFDSVEHEEYSHRFALFAYSGYLSLTEDAQMICRDAARWHLLLRAAQRSEHRAPAPSLDSPAATTPNVMEAIRVAVDGAVAMCMDQADDELETGSWIIDYAELERAARLKLAGSTQPGTADALRLGPRELDEAIATVLGALRMEWHRREGIPASGVSEDPYARMANIEARRELASALPRLIATFTLTSAAGVPVTLTGRALLANLDLGEQLHAREIADVTPAGQRRNDSQRACPVGDEPAGQYQRGYCSCGHHRGEHGPNVGDPEHMLDEWGACLKCTCASYVFTHSLPPVAAPPNAGGDNG